MKARFAFRDAIRASEVGLAHLASSHQLRTLTTPDGIHDISPAPPRPLTTARTCTGLALEFSTCFFDAPADHSPEVFAVELDVDPFLALLEHGSRLVGGIITLDDASFTAIVGIHSGAGDIAPFGCIALLDTGSSQTFISRDVSDRMLSVDVASTAC